MSRALDSALQKIGPWNENLVRGSKNGASDRARGGVKKKRFPILPCPAPSSSVVVTGAFRPDGLVFTRPCKIFQAKVFKEKKT